MINVQIILPDNDDMKGDDDSNDLRTLQVDVERNKALIHWWFYPASYDEWIESSLVEGDAMDFSNPSDAWRLGERFINDLERYNEWMVEFDYEIVEDDPDSEDTAAEGNNSQPTTSTLIASSPFDKSLTTTITATTTTIANNNNNAN
ncbi:hypothetical protein RFI_26835, partial [Reticulomyxa filosa]